MLLAAALVLDGCASVKPITLIDAPSGQQVNLQRDQEMILQLAANPSTGYRWHIELTASAVLDELDREQFLPTSNGGGAAGAGGVSVWRFRAARTGTDLLRLAYSRPFETKVPAAKSVVYTINVR
jgi:inhibitor of cysteine peptidase